MSAYIVANVQVTQPQQYEHYKKWSSQAIAEHGAKILVRGGAVEILEGDWAPNRLVILEFADSAAAKAFYNSQTYARAKQARSGAAIMQMIVVAGV